MFYSERGNYFETVKFWIGTAWRGGYRRNGACDIFFQDLPDNVKAAVADCGFTSPEEVFSHILKRDYHIPKEPLMTLTSAMSKKFAGYGYNEYTTLDAMRVSKTPTLFTSGDEDTFVPTWMTQENYDACVAPKRIFIVHGASHAASFFEDNELFMKELKEFLPKYVK